MKTKDYSANTPTTGQAEKDACEPAPAHIGMTLEEMLRAEPIRASEPIPDTMLSLLRPDDALYTRTGDDPRIEVSTERLGATDQWRVSVRSNGRTLQFGLAGDKQVRHSTAKCIDRGRGDHIVDGYRPPWLDLEYMPKLHPFRAPLRDRGYGMAKTYQFIEPISHSPGPRPSPIPSINEALRYSYPWRTIGIVATGNGTDFANPTGGGSGVLVGRNLMLTASHVVPWGRGPGQWWMRFIPGYRAGDRDPEPHASSFVEHFYGTFVDINDFEAGGKDYVICKLYRPLGDALGWMGGRSFGDEDDYFSRRYISVGYPDSFGMKPAVEFDIDIDDIDSDGGGLELETTFGTSPFGHGWSGGPLWLWENDKPYVVGILSGAEKDELDPRRWVFGGGGLMVDRIKYGQANFA
ncbi:MAG: hypothetical protein WAU91_13110 [Desulfatitalea sp.]